MSQERAREIIRKWLEAEPVPEKRPMETYLTFPVGTVKFTVGDFQQLESLIAEALQERK